MDKDLKIQILKSGGKKALKAYNSKKRKPVALFNTGTKTFIDKKHKPSKYRNLPEE